jgi:hypothetical protein
MSRRYTSSPPRVPPWHVAGQLDFTFMYPEEMLNLLTSSNRCLCTKGNRIPGHIHCHVPGYEPIYTQRR